MNDLMTYSLVGYTNLNDEEEEGPTEIETETEAEAEAPAADKKLRRFLAEAEAANKEMAAIRHLLARLQQAHGETHYSLSDPDSLRSLRRRINADLLLALRTAHHVRARLDAMDSDPEPAAASSVGAGLRAKLRALIADLQELRWRMAADHREAAARCYFAITGERPDEALLERIASMSGGDELMLLKKAVAEGRGGGRGGDLVVAVQEMEDRQEVASELERSLLELQQLFLDMAVLVDAQAHHLDDIKQQVAAAADYVGDGAQELEDARQYQKSARRKSAWIALSILLLLLLILAVVVAVVAINLSKKSTHLFIYIFTWYSSS